MTEVSDTTHQKGKTVESGVIALSVVSDSGTSEASEPIDGSEPGEMDMWSSGN